MDYSPLTPPAEKLLQEILDHRTDIGECDMHYWRNRFKVLNMSGRIQIQSIFQELRDSEMIFTVWKSGRFENLVVLNRGLSYFYLKKEKEEFEKNEEKRRKEEKENLKRRERINKAKAREKRGEKIKEAAGGVFAVSAGILCEVIDTVETIGSLLFFWL